MKSNNESPRSARVRPYGRAELAHLYYGRPASDRAVCRWLNKELSLVPGLMDRLYQLGYNKKDRTFTLCQTRVIFEALGQPDVDEELF